MSNDGGGSSGGSNGRGDDRSEQDAGALAQQARISGDSILGGIAGGNVQSPQAPAPGSSSLDAGQMQQMVEKLFIKVPERAGEAAMARMELSGDVLPGTSVQITRASDGSVQVQFISDNYNSIQSLNQHGQSLERLLEDKLGANVEVRVQDRGQEQNEGRSRNRQDYTNDEA